MTRLQKLTPILIGAMGLILGVTCWLSLRKPLDVEAFLIDQSNCRVVILDAGHGGEDGGAKSLSGIFESGINLAITQKTDALLRFYGVPTIMVRNEDISIHDASAKTIAQKKRSDLNNRVRLVNEVENGLLVSIHQNTFQESKYFGAQVFYGHHADSQPLALQMQELFRLIDPANTRQTKPVADTVFLMNHAECPAVLVECGFLTNPSDEGKLVTHDYQRKVASVIVATLMAEG